MATLAGSYHKKVGDHSNMTNLETMMGPGNKRVSDIESVLTQGKQSLLQNSHAQNSSEVIMGSDSYAMSRDSHHHTGKYTPIPFNTKH